MLLHHFASSSTQLSLSLETQTLLNYMQLQFHKSMIYSFPAQAQFFILVFFFYSIESFFFYK